ncbi:MAG TPA: hypothetical protein VLZ30_00155 [Verrucomicrobiae bacterium]|nr:hypothetical protein [Verrucomicrobiae bacterium]
MEIQPPGNRAFVIYAQPKPSWTKEHAFFTMGVFVLSVLAGYYFTLSLYAGLHQLSPTGAATHGNANPLIEVLRLLYSGFSR